MKWIWKRGTALLTAVALVLSLMPAALAAEDILTRGEAADLLVIAADDYNLEARRSDIIKGYPGGDLEEDAAITRVQALVMVARAFGPLPAPVGDSARSACPVRHFADIPAWAEAELDDILNAGIVEGISDTELASNETVTKAAFMQLIRRVYTLLGTNLRDDFYAGVNKAWLDASELLPTQARTGGIFDLLTVVDDQIAALIHDCAKNTVAEGSPEAKIAALYETALDTEGIERQGIRPLQPYLDEIARAETVGALMEVQNRMNRELCLSPLMQYGLGVDVTDSNRRVVTFSTFAPSMDQGFYQQEGEMKDAYLDFLAAMLRAAGFGEPQARDWAERYYQAEADLSACMMDRQAQLGTDAQNHRYTPVQLQEKFPNVDMQSVFAASGFRPADEIVVADDGLLNAAAGYFDQAHLETLKAELTLGMLSSMGHYLSSAFSDASAAFVQKYFGIAPETDPDKNAVSMVKIMLSEEIEKSYVNHYCPPEVKTDIEQMVEEIKAVYARRLRALDWLGSETKSKALAKLDTLRVRVGYPDEWSNALEGLEIRPAAQGGTLFENVIAVRQAAQRQRLLLQGEPVDKDRWDCPAYTVNAYYDSASNSITLPAGILQPPVYDVNAGREENLGTIGFIIAHEITHAFDNNGAKFDENGNAVDWWTPADYAAFQERCKAVIDWYDGWESAPGIACDGAMCISENVADLGAVSCITEVASGWTDPDYALLYTSVARGWRSTSSREYQAYMAIGDVHAAEKLRVNRTLQTVDQFYETVHIKVGDGMWTEPAERVSIW